MAEAIWTPSEGLLEQASPTRFARRLGCRDYPDPRRVSVDDPEALEEIPRAI